MFDGEVTHTYAPELNLDTLLGRVGDCAYLAIYEALANGRPGESLGRTDADVASLRARLFLDTPEGQEPDESAVIDAIRRSAELEMRLLTVERQRRFLIIGRGVKGNVQLFQRLVTCVTTSAQLPGEPGERHSTALGVQEADAAASPAGVRAVHASMNLAVESIQTAVALTSGMWATILSQKDRTIEQAHAANNMLSKELAAANGRVASLQAELSEVGGGLRRTSGEGLEKAGAFLKETFGGLGGAASLWGLVPPEIKEKLTPEAIAGLGKKLQDPTSKALFLQFITPGSE